MNRIDWLTSLPSTIDVTFIKKVISTAAQLTQDTSDQHWENARLIVDQIIQVSTEKNSLAAGLLYPFFDDTESTRKKISSTLGHEICELLQGVKRMSLMDELSLHSKQQIDRLRRMLLAIVDDARIVVIKLAERLAQLKQLSKADNQQQQHAATQTRFIYAPLANRLGIWQFKWQLEDWALRYQQPDIYKSISQSLNLRRVERDAYIQEVKETLTDLLEQSPINTFELSGRAKHIYSIHRKLQKKQIPFAELYDANAFRILVTSIADCYTVLDIIHQQWPHIIEAEFDDYIAKPKANGYQSIHTVVAGPQGHLMEIQIRSFAMHEAAELGVAAHWKYKENAQSSDVYEEKIHLLRDLIDWQHDLSSETNGKHKALYENLFTDRVYVFTPNNDILDLSSGATVLDAAYHIHTDIGHQCKGAKVNQKIVPLNTAVKTGDVIEIMTAKQQTPSRDWLNPHRGYITTKTARQKIRHFFQQQHHSEKLAQGIELWEKAAKQNHLNKRQLLEVAQYYHFKTPDALLLAIGLGHIGINSVIHKITHKESEKNQPIIKPRMIPQRQQIIKSSNTNSLLSHIAGCCQPLPGDTITGYITKGRGISIHRKDCHNIKRAKNEKPERLINMSWSEKERYWVVGKI